MGRPAPSSRLLQGLDDAEGAILPLRSNELATMLPLMLILAEVPPTVILIPDRLIIPSKLIFCLLPLNFRSGVLTEAS
jgi:hypothetical protein